MTQDEIDILCLLGYNYGGCDGCFIGAYDETFHEDLLNTDCCTKIYTVCKNQTLVIPMSDLLCNDAGSGTSITDVFLLSGSTGKTLNIVGTNIEVSSDKAGSINIGYTVTGLYALQAT